MKKTFAVILSGLLLAACGGNAPKVQFSEIQKIKSPGDVLELTVGISPEGTPLYTLSRGEQVVVKPSRLGFELLDQEDLLTGFTVTGVELGSEDETWEPVWGEEASIRNHYNEILVTFEKNPEAARAAQMGVSPTDPEYTADLGNPYGKGAVMKIRFRLYDDGLGFRYEFPLENKLTYFKIKEEKTEFAMTGPCGAYLRCPYMEPSVVKAYVSGPLKDLPGLHPVERDGNVVLYVPPNPGVFVGKNNIDRFPVVSDIQLYLDLKKMPGRSGDQADYLRENLLKWSK